jgi:hypothetical protein
MLALDDQQKDAALGVALVLPDRRRRFCCPEIKP